MKKNIANNPMHISIGLALILIGIYLMSSDDYFRWPPAIAMTANDDVVGFLLLLFGAGYIFWTFDKNRTARFNHFILSGSAGLMTLLTIYQFIHWAVVGVDMPWISNACITSIIMVLAARSKSHD